MFSQWMWFQDAYNYDFATIYNSNTPVATWQGEISFCAYNVVAAGARYSRASIIRRPWPIGTETTVGTKSMRQARRYG